MRKLLALPISLLFILLMTACTQKKEKVLHMIQAPSGKVTGDSKKGYTLELKEMHDRVIWFTDRPDRMAGSMQIKDFLQNWDKGKHGFKKDPPNAIVIINNSKPVVVELILTKWDKNKAIFTLKELKGQEYNIRDKRGSVIIYIDGSYPVNSQITD